MISEKVLSEPFKESRFRDGETVSFEALQDIIQTQANEMGFPVAFEKETLKIGSFLNSSTEDCLIVYHPDHKDDYEKYLIRIRYQGKMAVCYLHGYGVSKLMGGEAARSAAIEKAKEKYGFGGEYGSASFYINAFNNVVGGAARKQKIEEEKTWYGVIGNIMSNIFD